MKRTIRQIIPAEKVNMGGALLDQPLPIRSIQQIDPFLLIHHWENKLPGNQKQANVGVGPHPHRGFSPVTLIFKGAVHHQDSRGNKQDVHAGGVQWIDSGMGIMHSERPAKQLAEEGGDFEIIQFWVNLPAKSKMMQPKYQPLESDQIPVLVSEDGKIKTQVVAGELENLKGNIEVQTPLLILNLDIKKGGTTEIELPENYNAILYQLDGKLQVNESEATRTKDMTWFNNDGKSISIKGEDDTRAIILAGQPIDERVSSYGPFVMNTQSEIMEAVRDAQTGKMGILIEEFE